MIHCPICLSDTEPSGPLYRCRECGHIFEYPPIVRVKYGADYLRKYESYPTRDMSLVRLGFLREFISSGRLLDVGYGLGTFVKLAMKAGFDAFGTDVHGQNYGVREIDLGSDRTGWDVVTLYDSLEHFRYPRTLQPLFARARFVVISTPLRPDWYPERIEWKHHKPGEHLHAPSKESLDKLVGHELLASSNVEDLIRGSGADGTQNIITNVYVRVT